MISFNNIKEDAYEALAIGLASCFNAGDCILLSGELGMGKSAMARAFIRQVVGDDEIDVPSPTYTLVQTYPCIGWEWDAIWHFDLYRLENPAEIYELGIEQALDNGLSLIEWPERASGLLPSNALCLNFKAGDSEVCRTITIIGNEYWKDRLKPLEALAL